VAVAVSPPSRKSNLALATDLEPVYVRFPPAVERLLAIGEGSCCSRYRIPTCASSSCDSDD